MNDARILGLERNILALSSIGSNKQYNARLEKVIASTMTAQFKIVISSDNNNAAALKSSLKEDFKNSDFWQFISAKLPGSKIIDIIHKDW